MGFAARAEIADPHKCHQFPPHNVYPDIMLQCSNYKDRRRVPPLLRNFYIGIRFRGSQSARWRLGKMGYFAGISELRSLLAVAAGLRQLAGDRLLVRNDKRLYLTAAAALEARANRMASSLPDDGKTYDRATDAALHRPVDLLV
jgi:hypothetical protein